VLAFDAIFSNNKCHSGYASRKSADRLKGGSLPVGKA
jgi:hypothetical protein